jgi:hypothetical protein
MSSKVNFCGQFQLDHYDTVKQDQYNWKLRQMMNHFVGIGQNQNHNAHGMHCISISIWKPVCWVLKYIARQLEYAIVWKVQRGTYSKSWCYMYYWLLQLHHILAKRCNTSHGSVSFVPFRLCRSKSSPHAAFSLDSFMQLAPEFPSLSYSYGFGINP